jgi:transcriptional regulator with XRE-family HTH domain
MESNSSCATAGFGALRERLRNLVNMRIGNGEFTERGFARMVGVSQPQVHNILKGARGLSLDVADLMLAKLGISIVDLLTPDERSSGVLVAAEAFCNSTTMSKKPPTADLRRRFEGLKRAG